MAGDSAPLQGLRVLELATGVAGPYAGRLLAMLGATVVKVEPPGGDPARTKQIDDEPLAGTSPLFVHLAAGKLNASAAAIAGATWDAVLDDRVRAEVAGTSFDPSRADGPLLVSITPFGFDEAPGLGAIEHDVLAQARSGLIGVQGDPGREPLRLPGWQAQYLAGTVAAVGLLAALRLPGVRHLDVSWTACLLTGVRAAPRRRHHRASGAGRRRARSRSPRSRAAPCRAATASSCRAASATSTGRRSASSTTCPS